MIKSKKKGNVGENKFANWLQSQGVKAYKNSSSGGNMWKSDIHNSLDINFEVKTCKKINLMKCWQQTNRDASMSKSMPMLAIHFDHMPENSWLMVLHSEDWIEMIKSQSNSPPQPQNGVTGRERLDNQRELAYALNQLKTASSKVIKLLDR